MSWVRMTRIGQTQPFYDSRKDGLSKEDLKYIEKLESFRNRAIDPEIRFRAEQLISAAYERIEQERLELTLEGIR